MKLSSIGPVVSEEEMFENVDGRGTDGCWSDWYTISLPMSLWLRWAKKSLKTGLMVHVHYLHKPLPLLSLFKESVKKCEKELPINNWKDVEKTSLKLLRMSKQFFLFCKWSKWTSDIILIISTLVVLNTHYNRSNLIWCTVSCQMDEVIPSDHPRRKASRWYDLIHETWYCMPDQVNTMIWLLLYPLFSLEKRVY